MHHPSERLWGQNKHGQYLPIATDGACRNNGLADAVAGCGVYWGHNSIHNKSFQLNDGVRPTSQRAELSAAIYALRKFRNIYANGGFKYLGHLDMVVIKTDSAYLVNSMTDWIVKWRNNGYLNARGLPLCNRDLIEQLDGLCDEIDELGIQACFWQIPRASNADADELAKDAIY